MFLFCALMRLMRCPHDISALAPLKRAIWGLWKKSSIPYYFLVRTRGERHGEQSPRGLAHVNKGQGFSLAKCQGVFHFFSHILKLTFFIYIKICRYMHLHILKYDTHTHTCMQMHKYIALAWYEYDQVSQGISMPTGK